MSAFLRHALAPGLALMMTACGGEPVESPAPDETSGAESSLATQTQDITQCGFSPGYWKYWFAQDPAHGHEVGYPESDGNTWTATPSIWNNNQAFVTYGPYDTNMGAGTYSAGFYLRTLNADSVTGDKVATIEVVGQYGAKVYARREIKKGDFSCKDCWNFFYLTFKNPCYDAIETRVWYHDLVPMQHHVTLMEFKSYET